MEDILHEKKDVRNGVEDVCNGVEEVRNEVEEGGNRVEEIRRNQSRWRRWKAIAQMDMLSRYHEEEMLNQSQAMSAR